MKNRYGRFSAVFMTVLLLASLNFAQTELRYKELTNFHKVSDKLYRGGQPAKGGIIKLSELGIKTIINLRGEDENTRAEQKEAEQAGLRYFSVAMPGLSRPTDEQIARVMAIIDAPENGPVFVHCKRGADRTGTIIAIYRISHEDWTDEHAISEAKRRGMSFVQFGMKDYISDYYRLRKKNQPQSISTKTEVKVQP